MHLPCLGSRLSLLQRGSRLSAVACAPPDLSCFLVSWNPPSCYDASCCCCPASASLSPVLLLPPEACVVHAGHMLEVQSCHSKAWGFFSFLFPSLLFSSLISSLTSQLILLFTIRHTFPLLQLKCSQAAPQGNNLPQEGGNRKRHKHICKSTQIYFFTKLLLAAKCSLSCGGKTRHSPCIEK